MSAKFDQARFDSMLDDIETYLGYLKGNEQAWVYLQGMANIYQRDAPADGTGQKCVIDYGTPCPEGRFRLEFTVDVILPKETDRWAREDEIVQGTDTEWREGPKWARGIADVVRSTTERVRSPDVSVLNDAVRDMGGVLTSLGRALDPNTIPQLPDEYGAPPESPPERLTSTLGGLANGWHGAAADEFRDVCDRLGTSLSLYGQFAGLAAAELATATTVIHSAQEGLLKTVSDVRTELISQLARWQSTRQPPADGSEFPAWILDLLAVRKVYKGVKLLVEAVTDPKEVGEYFREIGKALLGELPGALMEGGDEPFKAARADAILTSLVDKVRRAYLEEFQSALDDLSTSTYANFMRGSLTALQSAGAWYPPNVPENADLTRDGDSYPGR